MPGCCQADNINVIGDVGARFENFAPTHLRKRAHREGIACDLHYLRDHEGREVDFAITKKSEIDNFD